MREKTLNLLGLMRRANALVPGEDKAGDTVKAGKADVSGREFYQAQAFHAEDVVTFTLRSRRDVEASWQLKHREEIYNILEVNHLGYMGDFMRLKCRKVTGEANK